MKELAGDTHPSACQPRSPAPTSSHKSDALNGRDNNMAEGRKEGRREEAKVLLRRFLPHSLGPSRCPTARGTLTWGKALEEGCRITSWVRGQFGLVLIVLSFKSCWLTRVWKQL